MTAQLQQLTQLVVNSPLPPVTSPPVSPPSTPMTRRTCPKLSCPPDFSGERHNGCAFLNSCSLSTSAWPQSSSTMNKRNSSGPSYSSKVVVQSSGPKMCSVRKWTPAFSLSKPGGTSNNSFGSTSFLLMRKWTRSMLWKKPPTTKEVGQWTIIWTTSKPWSLTQITQTPGC